MKKFSLMCVLAALLVACGDDGNKSDAGAVVADAAPGAPDAASGTPDADTDVPDADVTPEPFALSSTAIHGADFLASTYTCAGTNVSPPFTWTPGPAGTLSYALVLNDTSNNFMHSVIWDIPASVHALPEHVERVAMPSVPAGSKQTKGYDGQFGYAGPCPQGNEHIYEFELFALDVATMPGITTATGLMQVRTALNGAHKLASVKLIAHSNASRP